jgi:hypothetical protein
MLDWIGSILGSVMSGGITGLIGTGLTALAEYKEKKLAFSHEERMVELEQQTIKIEAEAAVQKTTAEYEGKVEVADSEAFAESFSADKATYMTNYKDNWFTSILFTIVDFIRGMTRPLLTFYLCAVTTWMAWKVYIITGNIILNPIQAIDLLQQIVSAVLYLTITACTWWFGTRGLQRSNK